MVQTISLNRLQQAEAIRYLEQWISVLRAEPLSEALTAVLEALEAVRLQMHAAFKKEQGSSFTANMQALEAERDGLISGIGHACIAARTEPDEAIRSAGAALEDNLELYGGTGEIIRQNVKKETTIIESILRDWREKPTLAAAATALSLGRRLTALEAANTGYNNLFKERGKEKGTSVATSTYTYNDKLDEARPLYDVATTLLYAGYASAKQLQQDTSTWLKAIESANAITREYASMLAARSTRAEKKSAAPTAADPS